MTDLSDTEKLLLCFPTYGPPSTKPVDFDKSFGGNLEQQTRRLLKVASTQRALMMQGITNEGAAVDPRNIIAAVDAYFPSVWRITCSLEAASEVAIQLNTPLKFKWQSTLGRNKKEYTFQVLVFEVCHALVVKALAHNDAAKNCAVYTNQHIPEYTEVAKQYRIGAGVFDFVANDLLPRWVNPPEKRPVDVLPPVLRVLSILNLVMAQRVTAAKAIAGGEHKNSLIARLLMGCADKYAAAARELRSLDKSFFEEVMYDLKDELGTMPLIMKALAYQYFALHAHEEDKIGDALAYIGMAKKAIDSCEVGPTLTSTIGPLLGSISSRISALYAEYNEENSAVYFASPTSPEDLVTPEPAFIVKAIPFDVQTPDLVNFEDLQKKDAAIMQNSRDAGKESHKRNSKRTLKELVPPKGVDPDVFNSLPIEMKREIVNNYRG